uniref:NANOG neighbor homeobox n=1 Tax=Oryctolagus cuniculus TaxID=9986 RepID=A0A5F9CTE9_RABIT
EESINILTVVVPGKWDLLVGLVETDLKLLFSTLLYYLNFVSRAKSWDQNPEQSNRNHSEDERQRKQNRREGGAGKEGGKEEDKVEKELQEELKKDEKEECEALSPKSTLASKSLRNSLWEKFKFSKHLTLQDILSMLFRFNKIDKQIIKWLCEKRKKYNKEMPKQKGIKRLKRPVSIRTSKAMSISPSPRGGLYQ